MLLALVAGCQAASDCDSEGPCFGRGQDAGADAGIGGAFDAGGVFPPIDSGSPQEPPENEFGHDACFNGVDDDANAVADCDDAACRGVPFCCLGESTPACCSSLAAQSHIGFDTCTEPSCDGQASLFGLPSPYIDTRALVPTGSAASDSGLVLGPSLDGTRERIVLTAQLAAPPGGCERCIDAIAAGIGDAVAGDTVTVRPDVAVLVRPARSDYALVLAGEVVWSHPLADGEPHEYTLELAPDGSVVLEVDQVAVVTAEWIPRPDRRALVYGRNANRPAAAPPPARALSVGVETGACEIPSALARDPATLLPSWSPLGARAPSAVLDGEDVLVAFEIDGAVHLARLGAGGWSIAGSGDLGTPALAPPQGEAYRDPELVREDDRWVLYVTHERGEQRSIARAEGEPGHAERFGPAVDLALAGAPDASLSAPSVARFGGETLLAAVATHDEDGGIVLLSVQGDELVLRGPDLASAFVVRARGGVMAFDADEVGGPALHVDGAGILRLYYAGRRGSRWSIGMVASGDGRSFAYAPREPVLRASGTGHDALSVLDPSVVRAGSTLQLFHTASDGVEERVARAVGSTRW